MSVEDVLRRVVEALSEVGIPYMLTGSLASSYYGRPRTTQDIDIVIAADSAQLKELVLKLPDSQYYVDEGAALEDRRTSTTLFGINVAIASTEDVVVAKLEWAKMGE